MEMPERKQIRDGRDQWGQRLLDAVPWQMADYEQTLNASYAALERSRALLDRVSSSRGWKFGRDREPRS